jgi:hypothetical protein
MMPGSIIDRLMRHATGPFGAHSDPEDKLFKLCLEAIDLPLLLRAVGDSVDPIFTGWRWLGLLLFVSRTSFSLANGGVDRNAANQH